jgi:hypothetical protein
MRLYNPAATNAAEVSTTLILLTRLLALALLNGFDPELLRSRNNNALQS